MKTGPCKTEYMHQLNVYKFMPFHFLFGTKYSYKCYYAEMRKEANEWLMDHSDWLKVK